MNIELIERAAGEIAEYSKTEAGLAELRSRLKDVSYELTTTKGMALAKADRAEVRTLRTSLEAKRKEIKAPALEHCRLIDAEAARITAELLKLEKPIDDQIKAEESRKEAERIAKEASERARILAITERIAGIRQYVELAASCRTAERIQSLKDKLAEIKIEGFEEFEAEAEQVLKQTAAKVDELLTAKLEQEAEQARIKAEQAAAAAAFKAEREAFAAEQAKAKAEADRLAAEHAAKAAAEAAQKAAAQAEFDAQRTALAAEAAAKQAEFEAKTKRQNDALAAERQKMAAEKAAFEAQVAEAKEKEEKEAKALADIAQAAIEMEAFNGQSELDDQNSVPAAPACCAPDALKEAAIWSAITNAEPSDADCMWIAVSAVAKEYHWTTEQATARLSAVQWVI